MFSDPFDIPRLRSERRTARLGHTIHSFDRLTSTNDSALELASRGAVDGTVIVADEQTAGRGRFGRSWHSAPGVGIWTSFILRPPGSVPFLPSVTLCAACAVAQAIEAMGDVPASLKWPNDVLIRNRKVAGLLAEMKMLAGTDPVIILGIGINVNHRIEDLPDPLRRTATSLRIETGRFVPRQAVFQCLLERFESLYIQFLQAGLVPLLPELRRRSALLNHVVELADGTRTITGTAVDLDEDGGLIIDTADQGRVSVYSGTVSVRGETTLGFGIRGSGFGNPEDRR